MSFSTILLIMFMVMFWLFRAIVALCTQFSIDLIGIVAYNLNIEIIISFITLVCIVLIVKRKLIGSLIYLLIYGMYFGEHLVSNMFLMFQNKLSVTTDLTMNLICDFIGFLLAIFVLFDMLIDKNRKLNPIDKKTDWYFKNEKYEEELKKRDSREDKNEYKFF